LKYKQYLVTQVRQTHIFLYDDTEGYEDRNSEQYVHDIVSDLADESAWDICSQEAEFRGEFDEK
jgi:hypothetical protein